MNWCMNDCHEKAMWCGWKNYLNKEGFTANAKHKRRDSEEADGDTHNVTKEFKITLTAMTSPTDYKMLKEHFLVKE